MEGKEEGTENVKVFFKDIGEWTVSALESIRDYNLTDISDTRRTLSSLLSKGYSEDSEEIKDYNDRLADHTRLLDEIEAELKRRGIN